jgi:hypothetical protein
MEATKLENFNLRMMLQWEVKELKGFRAELSAPLEYSTEFLRWDDMSDTCKVIPPAVVQQRKEAAVDVIKRARTQIRPNAPTQYHHLRHSQARETQVGNKKPVTKQLDESKLVANPDNHSSGNKGGSQIEQQEGNRDHMNSDDIVLS